MKIFYSVLDYCPKKMELFLLRRKHQGVKDAQYYKELMKIRIKYEGAESAVGFNFQQMGMHQFTFLKEQGLQKHHSLLDIGCGCLRGGIHFIDYLNRRCYTGCDISPEIITEAHKVLLKKDLHEKCPRLFVNKNLQFKEFNQQFDYILAQSVFSHLPDKDIKECFRNLHWIMHKSSVFYATFFKHEDWRVKEKGSDIAYAYDLQYFLDLGDRYDLQVKEVSYYHPYKQTILEIKNTRL